MVPRRRLDRAGFGEPGNERRALQKSASTWFDATSLVFFD
ncbi:hypothetical protein PAMC26577_24685 [Caballeronia sordidicola]|uniref:Uncharacterized protein n=1 Tax=Caballeronia sordidicola TaxID=196367 RepID=A0A242MIX6_CABSO|nr:hypothetical protein PAMC26577_24685 [Caballeronia sordidicola]